MLYLKLQDVISSLFNTFKKFSSDIYLYKIRSRITLIL